ncbi:MAG: ferritin-like domain-containing protein [Sphingobacteriaceae bacterium]
MENYNDKLADKLEHLLSICNDGKEGYKNASDSVEDLELRRLFLSYSNQRSAFATELKALLSQLGGDRTNKEGGPLGAMHRAWMDVKAALTGKDRAAILSACITGDKAAIEAYDDVLDDEDLKNDIIKTLVNKQRQEIREALSSIEKLEERVD